MIIKFHNDRAEYRILTLPWGCKDKWSDSGYAIKLLNTKSNKYKILYFCSINAGVKIFLYSEDSAMDALILNGGEMDVEHKKKLLLSLINQYNSNRGYWDKTLGSIIIIEKI